ncbi:MAG: hypothetical protein KU38_01755 [Sulfurovum sp. FS08-3]|nr:MAG: hypothetical protein KU38_01755 [Sulfurovum sp. FS08-3]
MKKINLIVALLCVATFANANYSAKKETSVMKHSYISTPKALKDDSCACANEKKKAIVNKDRDTKIVSAMYNGVKAKTSIN